MRVEGYSRNLFFLFKKIIEVWWLPVNRFFINFSVYVVHILQTCQWIICLIRRERMAVVKTTTYTIRAHYDKRCQFKSRPGEVYLIQHNVINFVIDLRQVVDFLWVLRFPLPIKLTFTI